MTHALVNRREILTLAASLSAVPALAAHGRPSAHGDAPAGLSEYVERYLQTMDAPGLTLALAAADGPIHTQAYGFVDLAARSPVTTTHLFEIGSISKSFVAVMMLQLREEGRLSFDQDIARYLPWLPIETDYGPIQIEHLLTHSSGLPEEVPWFLARTGVRYRQAYAPGSRFHYCNFGYEVLGRLIEKLDGMPLHLALRKRILEPLEMADTAPMIASPVYPRIAQSYVPQLDDRPYRRGAALAVAPNVTFERGSGCIASTPADMGRYMAMFINRGAGPRRRLLQEDSVKALASAHMPPGAFGPNAGYGYGLAVEQVEGHTVLWHTGGMASFASAMHIDLDAGFGAFASINAMQGFRPNAVARYALQVLRARQEKRPAPQAPSVDETALADTKEYEGTYLSDQGERIDVASAPGTLLLRIGGKRLMLRHQEDEQFMAEDEGYELFPWVFIRAPKPTGPAAQSPPATPVIELAWGPRSYQRSGAAATAPRPHEPVPPGLTGLYYNESPWIGSMRVVERRGSLWLNGAIPLERTGDALFRWADEPHSPETAEFSEFVDGQAQLLRVSGGELRRIPDLAGRALAAD